MIQTIIYLVIAICAFTLGYDLHWLYRRIRRLEKLIKQKRDKPKTEDQLEAEEIAKSTLIDPDDIIQQTKYEQEETMRKLNPQNYEDEV